MVKPYVEKIDEAIRDRASGFKCLENMQFYGLAEPVVRFVDGGEEWFPVVVDGKGEDSYVFVDDYYPVGIYHRILGRSYIPNPKLSYGDNAGTIIQTDMKLVCWGLRNQLNGLTADRMESFVRACLSGDATPARSSFDRAAVFAGEFRGVQFFLPEVAWLFSMDYSIKQTAVSKNCMDLSDLC